MPASLCRLLAGILLFFAGIAFLRKGLRQKTGARVEEALRKLTPQPVNGIIVGTLVTCAMQSSSAVTVIVVGLVDSGVIDVYQGFYIIMGANLGTCLTAYIVAFQTRILGPLALVMSVFFYCKRKQRSGRDAALVFLGLGCILEGVEITGSALAWLAEIPDILHILVVFGQVPFFGVLAGTVFTGIIQSSSVVTAILVGLVREGLVNLRSAISLALGSNIGTCMTTLIAGLGASSAGRFTALLHLVFNLVGVVAVLPVFRSFVMIIETISPADPGYRLANAHTLFNLMSIIVIYPWCRQFVDLVKGRREWI
ncbi:MAG: Na/Pi cotransporter family protein [Firmicutes bacterium]|jgi:phosphate:Na+ symporter|nr:Na/Pi cotransporter family protein [Bacillota bacterium]